MRKCVLKWLTHTRLNQPHDWPECGKVSYFKASVT